jgi:hypothetical protein
MAFLSRLFAGTHRFSGPLSAGGYCGHLVGCVVAGVALLAAMGLGEIQVAAQTPTVVLNDQTVIRPTTKRVGINLGSINYWDNGQMLKNLIGAQNPGFEPPLNQEIWALDRAGTATSFTEPDQWDLVQANNFAGGTYKVILSQSGGPELGCSGTIVSNTGPNYPTATGTLPVFTTSPLCAGTFSLGDVIVLTKSFSATPEAWWENSTAGEWGNIYGGGKLTSDTTDLCATCGSQAITLDATASGSYASIGEYFDSATTEDIFVLMNGTYQVSFWAKIAAGSPTLSVSEARLSAGGFNCAPQTPKLTTTWAYYTLNCVANETPQTTSPGTADVIFMVTNGSVYLDNVSFEKISGDPTNTTVFRDEVIAALKSYYSVSSGGNGGMLRDWLGQNGETFNNWTQPDYAHQPTGLYGGGTVQLSLEDYLNICKALNAEPYLEVPAAISDADAVNLIEFLAGSSSTAAGARRAALGQTAPWTSQFSQIHLSYCNECWNGLFAGQALPWRSTAPTYEFLYDYTQRATQVFADMRSAPDYSQSAFDLVMNAQTGVNYLMDTSIEQAHPDSLELEDYSYNNVSSYSTDQALWQPDFVEVYNKFYDPNDPTNFYQSLHDYQSLPACGANASTLCNVNIYEWGSGTENGTIDQTHLDYLSAGAGTGVISALQPLLNLENYGITADSYFALAEFINGALNGETLKDWGITVDMGGATNNKRPQFLGISLVNQSIIGPMYSCSIANNVTYNFAGSPLNGATVPSGTPATNAVPYLYAFCFENGGNRSVVLINTDLSSSHAVTFAGSNIPYGTVTQRQYAPSSPDLLNEAPTGSLTNLTPAKVGLTSATLNNPTQITLPPLSVTALDFTSGYSTTAGSVATPVLSEGTGNYNAAQTITITDSTPNASIYYTTDNSIPTTSSTPYTGPIPVYTSQTIRAFAVAPNYSNSGIASATYTIPPLDATPVLSLGTGTYTGTQKVTITDATAGATIYYTTNGTAPTTSSTVYTGPISVVTSETLQAIAAKTGTLNSAPISATYTIQNPQAQAPIFSIAGGTYYTPQTLSLSSTTPGATIYYTTNGTTPTTSSTLYTGPITVNAAEYIEAMAAAPGFTNSSVTANMFTMTTAVPVFSLAAGTYTSAQSLTLTDITPGAEIYYTTNGSTPNTTNAVYSAPIPITQSETIKVIASLNGYVISGVASATYTIGTQTAAPVFSLAAGSYTGTQSVTISDATPGATIYYTTNSTTPTASSTKYSGAISVAATETLSAIAVNGSSTSAVTSASYTISAASAAATPTFSLAPGTYDGSQTVSISDTTAGATIYYTTNGTTPTTSSTVYTAPITVSTTETLEAIAVAGSGATGVGSNGSSSSTVSAVAVATYTIVSSIATPAFSVPGGSYAAAQTVTITDSTPGAKIYYTTNGSTPSASSTLYLGPVTVSSTETLAAVAVVSGQSSAIAVANYTVNAVAGAPVYSIPGGVYYTPQTVALSSSTAGATIYYTTNQSTPTTASTVYTGPITVNAAEYVQAIAVAPGYTNSPVSANMYTMTSAAPTFSVASGSYSSAQSVTLSDITPGAAIFYTTNGATPTTLSTVYKGAITVSSTETLKAIASVNGYVISGVASATYTIGAQSQAAAPSFSVAGGTYYGPQTVTLTSSTAGATIYYTTNSTTPTTSSTKYTGPITVSAAEVVEAIAVAAGYAQSTVSSANYALTTAAPVLSLPGGSYTSAQTLTLSDTTPGASIYFTVDGSTPTTSSRLYTGPLTVSTSGILHAIAVANGYATSSVVTATYMVGTQAATAAPVFSLSPGTYATAQTVKITDPTAGAVIHYTTNGATPTASSSIYTKPLTVSATETVQAIAIAPKYSASQVTTAVYTISNKLFAPVFSLAGGNYSTPQSVTITDQTIGVTIHYTTDGVAPTASSPTYTGPIAINASCTLQAVAMVTGLTSSAVTSATYDLIATTPTISLPAGTYSTSQTVTLATKTAGASIYYTVNGTTPTRKSKLYTGPITVASTETLNAIAIASGYTNSGVATEAYTFVAAAPTFSEGSGTYSSSQSVTLTTATAGASIYYTLNGATPTLRSKLYTGPITVSTSETLSAIAYISGMATSPVSTAVYTMAAAAPAVSVKGGTYTESQKVALTTATKGAKIYYTLDGTKPSKDSKLYKESVMVTATATLKAVAILDGFKISPVVSVSYVLKPKSSAKNELGTAAE